MRQQSAPLLVRLDTGHIAAAGAPFVTPSGGTERRDATWAVSCWLVDHPNGALLWDTGLPDAWAGSPEGITRGRFRYVLTCPLATALGEHGLAPADITHLAFSHLHLDHAGNAGLFPAATALAHERELACAFGPQPPAAYDPAFYAMLRERDVRAVTGDHDVFGDGAVVMLEAPGHSPGHMALLVSQPGAAPVLLSGDLWYCDADRGRRMAPAWNDDLAATWRSMDRIEQVIAETGARLMIAHAMP